MQCYPRAYEPKMQTLIAPCFRAMRMSSWLGTHHFPWGRPGSRSREDRLLQKLASESLGIHPGDEAFQSPACSPLPCSLVAF